jgi:hypothetical protein
MMRVWKKIIFNLNIITANHNIVVDTSGSRWWVSAREYKCYKLQIWDEEFNVLFHAGRLFQQLLVDWYVKVESMRLDWYSKPAQQAIIHADLYQVCSYYFLKIK